MVDQNKVEVRDAGAPKSSRPALTFRGRKPTPGLVIDLWREGWAQRPESRKRILRARSFRRKEQKSLVQLAKTWRRQNPEAASWIVDVRHERTTLERAQIARVGALEPYYERKPLGFLDTEHQDSEDLTAYLNEWRQSESGPPVQPFFGKSVEDGEYGRVRLPAHLDLDGMPDFFEMLDEAAYEKLSEVERADYKQDEGDRRGRYVKVEKRDGEERKVRKPEYRTEPSDDEKAEKDPDKRKALADKREEAAQERHDKAVARYLLDRAASNGRLIPALDCVPIFGRGKGKSRQELVALIERALYYPNELIEAEYGWDQGTGDRLLVPQAYDAQGKKFSVRASEVGQGAQLYLYTAYLLCRAKDGTKHPTAIYCVGGANTWDAASGSRYDPESVGIVDFYEALARDDGKCPALDGYMPWSYHFGLHTEDDDPDHYGQPYLDPFISHIKAMEGNKTAINGAVAVTQFTGHFARPDPKLAAIEGMAEAMLEDDNTLKPEVMPGPGEIVTTMNEIVPARQAQVGGDAWKQLAADELTLLQATAVDQPAGAESGHAKLVGETIAKTAQRHQRDGVCDAVRADGEAHLRILHAIYEAHGVRWPIQTVDERPVGKLGQSREGQKILAYDPEWVGECNFKLKAVYPAESNIAEQDLAKTNYIQGVGSLERFHETMGIRDSESEWIKIMKDKMRQHPAYQMAMMEKVAQKTGNAALQEVIAALQAEQKMTEHGVPGGLENGIPTSALKRQGQQQGAGRPSIASSVRGGVEAGQMGTAARQADAAAQLQVSPGGQAA